MAYAEMRIHDYPARAVSPQQHAGATAACSLNECIGRVCPIDPERTGIYQGVSALGPIQFAARSFKTPTTMAALLQFLTVLSCISIAMMLTAGGTHGAAIAGLELAHHAAARVVPVVAVAVAGAAAALPYVARLALIMHRVSYGVRKVARIANCYALKDELKDQVASQVMQLFDHPPTAPVTEVEYAQYDGIKKHTSVWAYTLSGDLGVGPDDDPVAICVNACQFTSWCSAAQVSVEHDACELIDNVIDSEDDFDDNPAWLYVVSCEEYDCNA